MITDTVLQAIPRDDRGKNASRRLRATGRIPASVYGETLDSIPVSVNARELGSILRSDSGIHSIFTLSIDGKDVAAAEVSGRALSGTWGLGAQAGSAGAWGPLELKK